MVRLKAENVDPGMGFQFQFQFQYGTIKSEMQLKEITGRIEVSIPVWYD